jgi:hypothetical protein
MIAADSVGADFESRVACSKYVLHICAFEVRRAYSLICNFEVSVPDVFVKYISEVPPRERVVGFNQNVENIL